MTAVLNHGEVVLVDHMASDLKVVGAARVSIGKEPEQASKGIVSDDHLIRFLMTNGHGSPFEHAVFQWFVKAPIFVVREWQRHRMASYNEQSGRYSEFEAEYYVPELLREPDPGNKQSSVPVDDPADLLGDMSEAMGQAFDIYTGVLIKHGVAREMARMVLPLSTYTRFWFTINARSLMNFLMLRNAPAAQWEIQQYAQVLEADFARLMPMTHAAFIEAGRRAP